MEDPRWEACDLQSIAERAVCAVLSHLDLDQGAEVAVLACDDAKITTLNTDFRHKTKATNVLSWPAVDLSPPCAGATPAKPACDFQGGIELGDIAISYDTCKAEAQAAGKAMQDHVMHLLIHATLHLLGYDHIQEADAILMEDLEVKILEKMGMDNPY